MALDNLFADRESDSGTWVGLLAMQPLEYHEYPIRILRLEADAVVLDRKYPFLVFALAADLDDRIGITAKLERIAEQILEQLTDQFRIASNLRQRVPARWLRHCV